MVSKYTNWKEVAATRIARISQLEKENRELRERNENLYRAWRRLMDENYRLKKEFCEVQGKPIDVKKQIYRSITGEEYKG